MVVQAINVMCTAKMPPREWEFEGRSGVTYKVEISDGNGNVQLQCADIDVYNVFEVFKRYNVALDLVQTDYEGRKGVKAFIAYVEVSDES